MKLLSLISLFLLGTISFAGLLMVRRRYRIQRLNIAKISSADSKFWQEFANGVFNSHDHKRDPQERIELALRSGMRRLGVGCGIVTLNSGSHSRVLAQVVSDDSAPDRIQAGSEVSLALTYCGLLNGSRENLAIDHASLSDWRLHSAYRDLGWETFIGTRKLLRTGEYLAVGFYDWHAREHIYGKDDKKLVSQLANWITAINESQPVSADVAGFLPEMAQINFASAAGVPLSQ
jgi:hypothetical protein